MSYVFGFSSLLSSLAKIRLQDQMASILLPSSPHSGQQDKSRFAGNLAPAISNNTPQKKDGQKMLSPTRGEAQHTMWLPSPVGEYARRVRKQSAL